MTYTKPKIIIAAVARHRLVRGLGLLVLLSITVLAALWQQTSADAEIPASSRVTTVTATPASNPSSTPGPQSSAPVASAAHSTQATSSAFIVPDPAGLTAAVNKQRSLPVSYIPANLTVPRVALRYSAGLDQSRLRADAAAALEQLSAAANADGLQIALISGYRSAA
jgi:D-alanyl-D-alanine carboxypeptidase